MNTVKKSHFKELKIILINTKLQKQNPTKTKLQKVSQVLLGKKKISYSFSKVYLHNTSPKYDTPCLSKLFSAKTTKRNDDVRYKQNVNKPHFNCFACVAKKHIQ